MNNNSIAESPFLGDIVISIIQMCQFGVMFFLSIITAIGRESWLFVCCYKLAPISYYRGRSSDPEASHAVPLGKIRKQTAKLFPVHVLCSCLVCFLLLQFISSSFMLGRFLRETIPRNFGDPLFIHFMNSNAAFSYLSYSFLTIMFCMLVYLWFRIITAYFYASEKQKMETLNRRMAIFLFLIIVLGVLASAISQVSNPIGTFYPIVDIIVTNGLCMGTFVLIQIVLSVLTFVLGSILAYISLKGKKALSRSRVLLVQKIGISLIITIIGTGIRMIGGFLFAATSAPHWVSILLLRTIPDFLCCAIILIIFWPFHFEKILNHCSNLSSFKICAPLKTCIRNLKFISRPIYMYDNMETEDERTEPNGKEDDDDDNDNEHEIEENIDHDKCKNDRNDDKNNEKIENSEKIINDENKENESEENGKNIKCTDKDEKAEDNVSDISAEKKHATDINKNCSQDASEIPPSPHPSDVREQEPETV